MNSEKITCTMYFVPADTGGALYIGDPDEDGVYLTWAPDDQIEKLRNSMEIVVTGEFDPSGLTPQPEPQRSSADDLCRLRESGFGTQDLLVLHDAGMV